MADYTKLADQLLQAVDILADNKISHLNYDITVQMKLETTPDIRTKEAKASYQGKEYYIYNDNDVSCTYGNTVYVLIPKGDYTQRKLITGVIKSDDELGVDLNVQPFEQYGLRYETFSEYKLNKTIPSISLRSNKSEKSTSAGAGARYGIDSDQYKLVGPTDESASFTSIFGSNTIDLFNEHGMDSLKIEGYFDINKDFMDIIYGVKVKVIFDKIDDTTNSVLKDYPITYDFNSSIMYGQPQRTGNYNQLQSWIFSLPATENVTYKIKDVQISLYSNIDKLDTSSNLEVTFKELRVSLGKAAAVQKQVLRIRLRECAVDKGFLNTYNTEQSEKECIIYSTDKDNPTIINLPNNFNKTGSIYNYRKNNTYNNFLGFYIDYCNEISGNITPASDASKYFYDKFLYQGNQYIEWSVNLKGDSVINDYGTPEYYASKIFCNLNDKTTYVYKKENYYCEQDEYSGQYFVLYQENQGMNYNMEFVVRDKSGEILNTYYAIIHAGSWQKIKPNLDENDLQDVFGLCSLEGAFVKGLE